MSTVRELMTVQFGSGGNRIGSAFWEQVCKEHSVDFTGTYTGSSDDELYYLTNMFSESITGRYSPRVVLTDLEYNTLDEITSTKQGTLFDPSNFVFGQDVGTSNNFAKGFYTNGARLIEELLETVRREMELMHNIQGIQIVNTLGGGTGSGFAALFMSNIVDLVGKYPPSLYCHSLLPSSLSSEIVEENYNALLALHYQHEYSTMIIPYDNEKISNIGRRLAKNGDIGNGTWKYHNSLIGRVMCGVTTGVRFPTHGNTSLHSISYNLIPYPHLCFFQPTLASVQTDNAAKVWQTTSVNSIAARCMDPIYSLCTQAMSGERLMGSVASLEDTTPTILSACLLWRGQASPLAVKKATYEYQVANKRQFAEFYPNNLYNIVSNVPPAHGEAITSTAIINSTGVKTQLLRLSSHFKVMYDRGAFVHWYTDEGMPIEAFDDAFNSISDVIALYENILHGEFPTSTGSQSIDSIDLGEADTMHGSG